jgi:hypothetical protein
MSDRITAEDVAADLAALAPGRLAEVAEGYARKLDRVPEGRPIAGALLALSAKVRDLLAVGDAMTAQEPRERRGAPTTAEDAPRPSEQRRAPHPMTCEGCGAELPPPPVPSRGGRPRRWCSEVCRLRHRDRRRRQA